MTTAKETLAMIEDHPLTKTIRAERAAEILKKREEAALKVEQLRREAETMVLPGLQAELATAGEELARHDEKRKVLQTKVSDAAALLYAERLRISRETSEAETVLLSTSDPKIDDAILFFRDKHENLLTKSINRNNRLGDTNIFTLTRKLTTWSNEKAIRTALTYCLEAIRELERVKLIPVLDVDRIEAIKAGIPDPNEMTEISADKPLPGGKDINPLSLLPSADEMDWKIGKLKEKVKKLTGR